MTPYTFRILRSFPEAAQEYAWRDFLARADWPSHYTTPEYFLEPRPEEIRPFAILALDGPRIVAVATGSHQGDAIECGNPCLPQICFDQSVDCPSAAITLAEGLLVEAGAAPLVIIYGWTPIPALRSIRFRLRALPGVVMLDLRQGEERLFSQMHSSRRTNVRYATKHSVKVFQATCEEEVAAYYSVYCRWHDAHREQLPWGRDPFDRFARRYTLRNNRRLFLARHGGRIIAGVTVRFLPGGLLEMQQSSSLREFLWLHPNDLLIWKTIEWGCREGFARYSLGGNHTFFQRTGGMPAPVYRHQLDRTWCRRYEVREALERNMLTSGLLPPLRTLVRAGRVLRRILAVRRLQTPRRHPEGSAPTAAAPARHGRPTAGPAIRPRTGPA